MAYRINLLLYTGEMPILKVCGIISAFKTGCHSTAFLLKGLVYVLVEAFPVYDGTVFGRER